MGTRLSERRRSILITDDDAVTRESLREALEPEGFRTYMASCGEEAIDIVREREVHLALLDMHLPRLTGLETLRIVKEIKRPLPCIILTADVSDQLLHEALSLQAFSVIAKPVSKHLVVYMVTRALRRPGSLPWELPEEGREPTGPLA